LLQYKIGIFPFFNIAGVVSEVIVIHNGNMRGHENRGGNPPPDFIITGDTNGI